MTEAKTITKLNKYEWNEPDAEKRTWADDDYSKKQLKRVLKARESNKKYGNIDDLNPDFYNEKQMKFVSKCRGLKKNEDFVDLSGSNDESWWEYSGEFPNIDDLDPSKYNIEQMKAISMIRSDAEDFLSVDDLDPSKYKAKEMLQIAKQRRKDSFRL